LQEFLIKLKETGEDAMKTDAICSRVLLDQILSINRRGVKGIRSYVESGNHSPSMKSRSTLLHEYGDIKNPRLWSAIPFLYAGL